MTTPRVRFGLGLSGAVSRAGELLDRAVRADRDGLDVVTVADHPWSEAEIDAYAALGAVLGRTRRVTGAVNVTNTPSRPAPVLARALATLSELSGGRVVYGVGAGGAYEKVTGLGIEQLSPAAAVRQMTEAIAVVRALTGGGGPVHLDGEFYRVAGLLPAAAPTPPIWTGSLGPASLAATGRLADGWIPAHGADWRSERVLRSRPLIDEAAAAAGRDPADVITVHNVRGRITPEPLAATRDDTGAWIGGSVDQWVEELTGAVLEHRADGFLLFPTPDGTPVDVVDARWAREIAPAVRTAVGPAAHTA